MPNAFDPRTRQVFSVNFEQQERSKIVVSCRDYSRYYAACPNTALGWSMVLPKGSPFERQVRASNRQFSESAKEGGLIEFAFGPGQECFGHRVATAPPRLTHFEGATEFASWNGSKPVSSITPIMRRNAKEWDGDEFVEKMMEETAKREEALRREGLSKDA
jgi:hypothetical protein